MENHSINEDDDKVHNINDTLYYDSVIFVVQICDKLFEKVEDLKNSESFYNMIIKAYENLIKNKIISNPSDSVGIIFYDTDISVNYFQFNNIYEFQTLSLPSAELIQNASKLFSDIPKKKKEEEKCCFNKLITLIASLFNHKLTKPNNFKRVFLFTQDESPLDIKDPAFKDNYNDLLSIICSNGIEIELFPIIQGNDNFDLSKFYNDIISYDSDEINLNNINSKNKFKDLFIKLKKKEFKKKMLAKGELTLGEGCDIGIKFYTLIRKISKPTPNILNKENNMVVKKLTKYISKKDESTVSVHELGRFVGIGGEKITFENDDLEQIKKFEEPQLTLLGFKSISKIKPYHNLRNSYFLYPDENKIKNSSLAFDGLIKEMKMMDKVAICKYITKKSTMKLVALLPQIETYCEESFSSPSGFNMIFIPFTNDIRNLDDVKTINTFNTLPKSKDLVVSRNLINKMTVDFDISSFENPDLQKFYSYLQALALNTNNKETFKSGLEYDSDFVNKIYKDIEAFKNYYEDVKIEKLIDLSSSSEDSENEKDEVKPNFKN